MTEPLDPTDDAAMIAFGKSTHSQFSWRGAYMLDTNENDSRHDQWEADTNAEALAIAHDLYRVICPEGYEVKESSDD